MTFGSLFSGIGGFDLGLERAGMSVKWQVEIDPYCQRVLAKHWPTVPRYGDIRTVDWAAVEPVELLCGGFPCQDLSFAGKRAGIDGERSGLWGEYVRAIRALRPRYVLVENVPGLLSHAYMGRVLGDLAESGYDAEWDCLPASAVGAPHRRDRVWLVADAARELRDRGRPCGTGGNKYPNGGQDVADTERQGSQRQRNKHQLRSLSEKIETSGNRWWQSEPAMGELVNGVSGGLVRFDGRVTPKCQDRIHKLRGLGNAVVPQIVEALGRMILEAQP